MIRGLICILLVAINSYGTKFYVVNGLDESLGWVEYETGEFETESVTLGNIPNDVFATETSLYVVNSGYNTLQIIDRQTMTTIREIELTGAANPYSVVVYDNRYAAVTGWLSNSLTIVDLESNSVDTTFVVGLSPQAVAFHNDLIYVLNTGLAFPIYGDGLLKRYNKTTFELVDSVVVGMNSQAMEFIGDELHIVCTGNYDDVSGSVDIVDLMSMTVEATIPLGGSPGAISAAGNDVFVAAGGWGEEGFVYRYNATTRQVINAEQNPVFVGVGASDIIAMPNGDFVVTCFQDATIEFCSPDGVFRTAYNMSAGAGALGVWWGSSDVPNDPEQGISKEFGIASAYPNPFNGVLNFKLESALHSPNSVEIFDVLGQKVGAIPVGTGETEVSWLPGAQNGKEVSAGIYFARLKTGMNGQPIRVVYLK